MHYPFLICFMNILGTSLLAVHIPLIVFCFLIICKVVSERIYVTDRSLLYHLFVRVVVMESLNDFVHVCSFKVSQVIHTQNHSTSEASRIGEFKEKWVKWEV
jgi:hypothetical protein